MNTWIPHLLVKKFLADQPDYCLQGNYFPAFEFYWQVWHRHSRFYFLFEKVVMHSMKRQNDADCLFDYLDGEA